MNDLLAFLSWWIILQLFGLAALPLVTRVFSRLPDRGYAFAKTAGLLLVSYVLWLGASSGVLINDRGGILFALLLVAAVSAWITLQRGTENLRARISAYWQAHKGQIITAELLFLLAFAGWALVRAYAPDKIIQVYGEKYMEIAFLNGILNSPHFPPMDPWLSGYAISYYYFGYVMMGLMAKLSGVAATVSFDLYDALIFALTALTAYGVVSNMVASSGGRKRSTIGFGLLGALFVTGIGNLQGLLEALYSADLLPEAFWSWIAIPNLQGAARSGSLYPGDGWWWWRASRVLNDLDLNGLPVYAQPIDEFPFFSFLLGDNHPHKMALPFVLLAVGLAFTLLLRSSRPIPVLPVLEGRMGPRRAAAWLWQRRSDAVLYLFAALALGGLAFLNTWDFPIYLGLVLLADMLGRSRTGVAFNALLKRGLWMGLLLGTAAVLMYLFFYLSFSSQAGGILPYIFPPTRLAQYLVMFGPFIFVLIVFLVVAARQSWGDDSVWRSAANAWLWIAGGLIGIVLLLLLATSAYLIISGENANPDVLRFLGDETVQSIVTKSLLARLANPWLFLLLTAMLALAVTAAFPINSPEEGEAARPALPPAVLLALLMAFTGIALTLSVEFVYLRDNFGLRMNTIFKFYFQGWVLMALAAAFGTWWTLRSLRSIPAAAFSAGLGLLLAAGLVYPVMGIRARTESFSREPSLDASGTVSGRYPNTWASIPDDYTAIEWMRENVLAESVPGDYPVILEATNGSYQHSGRVSAFTGLPALLGWPGHEEQWRGTRTVFGPRESDIMAIYTTPDDTQALDLLRKWEIAYVILGEPERQYISRICNGPENPCNSVRALAKFERILTPVFSQGSITIYRVP